MIKRVIPTMRLRNKIRIVEKPIQIKSRKIKFCNVTHEYRLFFVILQLMHGGFVNEFEILT